MPLLPLSQTTIRRACWMIGIIGLLFAVAGCSASGPFYGRGYAAPGETHAASSGVAPREAPVHVVYLIGDAGDTEGARPVLRLLARELETQQIASTVVFLGDNAYPRGLPAPGAARRARAERTLDAQLRALHAHDGQAVFLPGNHDWNDGNRGGWAAVRRQEAYLETHADGSSVAFVPDGGCPGPEAIRLTRGLTLLVLDTSWWIYSHEKPTPANSPCEAASDAAFLGAVDSLLARQPAGQRVLVAAHHPLYSNGPHGGALPYRVLAPFSPLYRWISGGPQDLFFGRYETLRAALLERFAAYPGLVYAAGHDHSLQYHPVAEQHYLVSGAGSDTTSVAKTRTTAFAYSRRGFWELAYYESGRVRLRAWIPKDGGGSGQIVFQTDLETNLETP